MAVRLRAITRRSHRAGHLVTSGASRCRNASADYKRCPLSAMNDSGGGGGQRERRWRRTCSDARPGRLKCCPTPASRAISWEPIPIPMLPCNLGSLASRHLVSRELFPSPRLPRAKHGWVHFPVGSETPQTKRPEAGGPRHGSPPPSTCGRSRGQRWRKEAAACRLAVLCAAIAACLAVRRWAAENGMRSATCNIGGIA